MNGIQIRVLEKYGLVLLFCIEDTHMQKHFVDLKVVCIGREFNIDCLKKPSVFWSQIIFSLPENDSFFFLILFCHFQYIAFCWWIVQFLLFIIFFYVHSSLFTHFNHVLYFLILPFFSLLMARRKLWQIIKKLKKI